MVKRCTTVFLIIVMLSSITLSAYSDNGADEEKGDVMINSILTGEVNGEGGLESSNKNNYTVDTNNSSDFGEKYEVTERSERSKESSNYKVKLKGYELLTFEFKGKTLNTKQNTAGKSTSYKYKKVNDGSGPTIIFLTGSGVSRNYNHDRADEFMDNKALEEYNILVVTADSPDLVPSDPKKELSQEAKDKYLRSLSYEGEYGDEYRETYGNAVIECARNKFPDSKEYTIVTWSLGGCAADSAYSSAKEKGIDVLSTYSWEGVYEKGGKLLGVSKLEADKVPSYYYYYYNPDDGSITQNEGTMKYEKATKNPNAHFTNVLGLKSFLYKDDKTHEPLQIEHGTMNTSQDLFDAIRDTNKELREKKDEKEDTTLKDNQSSLLNLLNKNSSASLLNKVKDTAKKVVSSVSTVLSNIASAVTKTTNNSSKSNIASNSISSQKASDKNTSVGSNRTSSNNSTTSIWSNNFKKITSKLNSPKNLLNTFIK